MNQEISVTPAAVLHIQKMCEKQGTGIGLRVSIKNSGCSGKSYVVALITKNEINANDHIYDIGKNLKLCVDPESFAYIKGTTIDYLKKGFNSSFVFHNPNEKASCGCGESFYV